MKIMLNLDGWRKVIDVSQAIVRRGFIDIALYPPINLLADEGSEPVNNETLAKKITFVYKGKKENGLDVFQCK